MADDAAGAEWLWDVGRFMPGGAADRAGAGPRLRSLDRESPFSLLFASPRDDDEDEDSDEIDEEFDDDDDEEEFDDEFDDDDDDDDDLFDDDDEEEDSF